MNPRALYLERCAAWEQEHRLLTKRERRFSSLRLGMFLAAAVVLLGGLEWRAWSPWWALVPAAAYAILVLLHDRCIRSRSRAERSLRFFEAGRARLEGRWAGRGNPGTRFLDPNHPFAGDLDLFGEGSLFELICAARTIAGENLLARWLLGPWSVEESRLRQPAVAELAPRLDLRLDMTLLAEDVRSELEPDRLSAWASAPPSLSVTLPHVVGVILVLFSLAGAVWLGSGGGAWPLLAGLGGEFVFAALLRPRVSKTLRAAGFAQHELELFGALLGRMERELFSCPALRDLSARIRVGGQPASYRIGRLSRLVHLLDARRNQLFAPFSAVLLWGTLCALGIERWRQRNGAAVRDWLVAVAEFEALSSLGGYAFEHPDDTFPELLAGGTEFVGRGIGHPMMQESECVRNDVELGREARVWVVSGSNMSGKSTLLRSVGTNFVLANAGAPVRAEALRVSPLRLGASIRTMDSLREGMSRFYAEIRRLRQIMDLHEEGQGVLFLLDEVLHGTNSHDRQIGAEALVRGFLKRGAIGLVSTHDLSLAKVAESLAPLVGNVHFEDQMVDGEMRFDYKVHPGVVTHSNALALMRSVGLEV